MTDNNFSGRKNNLNMSSKRRPWGSEEDDAIVLLVKEYGEKQWALVARKLHEQFGIKGRYTLHRTGKQCRERWHNQLDPSVTKNTWSTQEEAMLFEAHKKHGNKWSEIAHHLPGRSDNAVKNHFYSTIRRNLRKINKQRPSGEKLKGNIHDLLQYHETATLLMTVRPHKSYLNQRKSQRLSQPPPLSHCFLLKDCEDLNVEDFLDNWEPARLSNEQPKLKPKPEPIIPSRSQGVSSRSSSKGASQAFTYGENAYELLEEYREQCQTDESEPELQAIMDAII